MKDYKVDKASLSASFCQEVYQVVREIPVGKVSTYGGIAALLGMPQCSRMVGRALKQIPDDLSAPCHRVVNASGRLVPGWTEQKQLLLEEGISFKQNGCVDLKNILLGNVVTHLYLGLNAVLRSAGHPQKAMYATIATVVINTILDPVFIYGFGWGIQGAAIATITAQVIALAWQFKLFSNKEELLHFHKGIFRLKKKIVFDSLAIGMAPFLMNLAACFIVILINKGLKQYGGDLAIGAFGIVNRLVFLFVMIVMGLNQGMQPIAGYNYGAKQYPRVTKVLKITIYVATLITTIGFLMGMLIPDLAVSIFTTDEELVRISAKGLRIVVMFFPIVGFQMVTSNFFQSIGMASKAIFLSVSRQVLILIPCLLILPHFYGQLGVWISMPISDLIASMIAGTMLWYQFRQFSLSSNLKH